jgi:hypothetical protein
MDPNYSYNPPYMGYLSSGNGQNESDSDTQSPSHGGNPQASTQTYQMLNPAPSQQLQPQNNQAQWAASSYEQHLSSHLASPQPAAPITHTPSQNFLQATSHGGYPAPYIGIQSPTPHSSPLQGRMLPHFGHLYPGTHFANQATQETRDLPARVPPNQPSFSLTARQMLDIDLPETPASSFRQVAGSNSSLTSEEFPTVGPLAQLPWPLDYEGYQSLPNTLGYHPPQHDPTTALYVEADAIRFCHSLVLNAVNLVLKDNLYGAINANNAPVYCEISTVSEDYHLSRTTDGIGNVRSYASRVDFGWDVFLKDANNRFISNTGVKFAVLEFKRPGVIDKSEWEAGYEEKFGTVGFRAGNVARQLVKYAYTRNTPFVGVCDWFNLILMKLDGTPDSWQPNGNREIPAKIQFLTTHDMKRGLFIWLRMALKDYLQRQGFTRIMDEAQLRQIPVMQQSVPFQNPFHNLFG